MSSSPRPDTRRRIRPLLVLLVALAPAALAGVPNPMRPPRSAALAPRGRPRWTLDGIVRGRRRRFAVINGHPVRPGGTIDGARVVRVGHTSVTLVADGRTVRLRVLPAAPSVFRPLAPGASPR